jgi:hypothetical protein
MKGLSIEEKARRYDEAIINGSRLWECDVITRESYEYIFPELRESDDERVKNALIKYFKERQKGADCDEIIGGLTYYDILDWLEKQGKDDIGISESTKKELEDNLNKSLEKETPESYNEFLDGKESADKTEPKFNVGDWIASNVSHEDYRICKILNIENGEYTIESIYGYQGHNNFETFDKDYHLWTIQDSKDGDALVVDNGLAFIYNGYLEEQQWPFAYGGINIYDRFNICDGLLPFTHQKVIPATKEQRDLLFSKMKEAGYKWDAEKKELKAIEEKPANDIEPKFKVGDWCIDNEDDTIFQIVRVLDNTYNYRTIEGEKYFCTHYSLENDARLWTIQDAKDGDVLATLDHILIFEKFLSKDGGVSYCHYDFGCSRPQFNFNKDDNWYFGKEAKVYPATKEQRDLLFQKMKEAGYEWDAEKKELKKVDNEEVNGEDYGIDSLWHAQRILEMTLGSVDGYQTDDGILEHKCAISAVKKLYKQKPDWSEEDEKTMNKLLSLLLANYPDVWAMFGHWLKSIKERAQQQQKQECSEDTQQWIDAIIKDYEGLYDSDKDHRATIQVKINILKSLRHQNNWKPSYEQMKLLREVQQALLGKDCQNRFVSFMYELKRLRG